MTAIEVEVVVKNNGRLVRFLKTKKLAVTKGGYQKFDVGHNGEPVVGSVYVKALNGNARNGQRDSSHYQYDDEISKLTNRQKSYELEIEALQKTCKELWRRLILESARHVLAIPGD